MERNHTAIPNVVLDEIEDCDLIGWVWNAERLVEDLLIHVTKLGQYAMLKLRDVLLEPRRLQQLL